MKIRTRLFLQSGIFIISITIIGFIIFNIFGQINRETKDNERVHMIIKDVFELNIITYEYFMHQEKRMQQQWLLKYDSVGKLLERMRKEDPHPEHLSTIEVMIVDYKKFGALFSQLQVNLAKRKILIEENKPQAEINLSNAAEERLSTEALMRSHRITTEAFKLAAKSEQIIIQTRQRINLIIIFSITGFLILSSCISILTLKAITRPINELTKGAEIVGKGNLEHKIDLRTKNEMEQLANSFNKMTTDLQEITVSRDRLEKEITERRQVENKLRRLKDELEIKVAERTKELESSVKKLNKGQKAMLSMVEDLNQTSKELKETNIKLKGLDYLKSMFIASMSHELRTPLNSIIGFTSIILQGMVGKITEEQRKQLTMVKKSAAHLLALINDVIDVSKIEAEKVELGIEEFNLSDLVKEVKDSFSIAAEEKELKMFLEMPKELVMESDERRTKQVIMNLVSNAVKFTDKGEIKIKASIKDGKVEVSVKDTGIGIEKKAMDNLFKPFSRIPAEGTQKEGTGLGLYLSKKLADLLGGEIKAESKFGDGSKFTFVSPLKHEGVKT